MSFSFNPIPTGLGHVTLIYGLIPPMAGRNRVKHLNSIHWERLKLVPDLLLTLFLPAMGGISPYMSVTWPSPVGIGLNMGGIKQDISLTIWYCRTTTQSQTLEVTAGNILHSRLERCYWKERYNHNQPYRRKLHQQIASLWSKWLGLPSLCAKLAGRDGDRMVGWMEMDIIWMLPKPSLIIGTAKRHLLELSWPI